MDFSQLYEANAAGLYGLCYRLQGESHSSERLFAEVWKRAYERFPEAGDSSLFLARHLAEAYRRAARTTESSGSGTSAAVLGLAPEYRLPLVLRDCGGLSYSAIASALDVPVATVRARMARARALLRTATAHDASSSRPTAQVDDELLAAYLDGELSPGESMAVDGLLHRDEDWRARLSLFRTDAEGLRGLHPVGLSDSTRDIVFRSVTESFALGAERRRVPRYKRRWMLLAALAVPSLLTLVYLQNPTHDSRLYLRDDHLVLRAGRSGEKSPLPRTKTWTSPPLWGARESRGEPSLSFQLDAGEVASRTVEASVEYDFDGDGSSDRVEKYQPVQVDGRSGWERFRPAFAETKGELRDFQGGRVILRLASPQVGPPLELSGSPGELVLPYRRLRAEP